MNFKRLSILTFFSLFLATTARTQSDHYTPYKTFSKNDKILIERLRSQLKNELEQTPKEDRKRIEPHFELKTKYLIHLVESGYVIDDPPLQHMVDSVFSHLAYRNKTRKLPGIVLIIKSPVINAACYGDGVFAVSVGMLSRMSNISQLAFIFAHELAHYEQDHVKQKILQLVASDYEKKLNSNFRHLWESDDIKPEELTEIQRLVYTTRNFSREREYEADSIGFEYLKNSGFDERQALSALDKLDSANISKFQVGLSVFVPLDNEHYLLDPYWMRNRLSVYRKPPSGLTFLADDSLRTHPEIELRKKRLPEMRTSAKENVRFPDFNNLVLKCDFEVVESQYWLRQGDRALFSALELLTLYPQNEYLVSMICKILIRACENSIDIPTYTYKYDETLLLVNNFLQNTTTLQKAEIAFHFLNNENNFNDQSEEHYYLLWKICSLTDRKTINARIKEDYKSKFPDGAYFRLMKDPIPYSEAMKRLNRY